MKRKISLLLIVIAVLFLPSCGTLYIPNKVNAPVITKKNEKNITLGLGTSGYSLNGAYSPWNKFAAIANVNYDNDTDLIYKNMELGAGMYFPLNKHFVYDFYLGGGLGGLYDIAYVEGNRYWSRSKYFYGFGQTSINYVTKYASIGLVGKFTFPYLSYKTNNPYIDLKNPVFFNYDQLLLNILVGYKFVYLNAQFGLDASPSDVFEYSKMLLPITLDFGLTFKF